MGRPKKENAKDKQIRLRLTEDEHKRLKEVSKEQGYSVSDFIRSCVNLYMTRISKDDVFDED